MKAFLAIVVLLICGMVGFVAWHESSKTFDMTGPATEELGVVATISKGQRVEIGPTVPRHGVTIVEFTAEF